MANLGFSQSLQTKQSQELLLLPRLVQAVEVLQLPAAELDAFLRAAYEENVALRLDEPRAPGPRGSAEASAARDEWLQNQPARGPGLSERVREQLALLELAPAVAAWAELLAECLDEDGLLRLEDDELVRLGDERSLEGGVPALVEAIAALQSLEPAGVGARDPVEALVLQLDPEDPDHELLRSLLVDHLEDVAKNRLPQVARSLGLELERLQEILGQLRGLDPRPGARLSSGGAPPIVPEVVVELGPEGVEVRVDQSGLPAVSLDPEVGEILGDRSLADETKTYLRQRLDRARWLVEAVERRKATLLRVASALFAHQRAFLEHGAGHLLPLRMSTLADELELHVSTVSRAVSGKYAWTPRGVVALRDLFQASAGASESAARTDVREQVRAVVEGEDPAQPLSDEDIVSALQERGLQLARRTVAKYRRELGIPSSYRRRRFS